MSAHKANGFPLARVRKETPEELGLLAFRGLPQKQLVVDTARSQQRGVKGGRIVGRHYEHYVLGRVKAVKYVEQPSQGDSRRDSGGDCGRRLKAIGSAFFFPVMQRFGLGPPIAGPHAVDVLKQDDGVVRHVVHRGLERAIVQLGEIDRIERQAAVRRERRHE